MKCAPFGARGIDLDFHLVFSERRSEGGQFVHGGIELLDLTLLHGLAQQSGDRIWEQEPSERRLLSQFVR